MSREQELTLLSKRLRKMLMAQRVVPGNDNLVNTLETLLTLLDEHLEEWKK